MVSWHQLYLLLFQDFDQPTPVKLGLDGSLSLRGASPWNGKGFSSAITNGRAVAALGIVGFLCLFGKFGKLHGINGSTAMDLCTHQPPRTLQGYSRQGPLPSGFNMEGGRKHYRQVTTIIFNTNCRLYWRPKHASRRLGRQMFMRHGNGRLEEPSRGFGRSASLCSVGYGPLVQQPLVRLLSLLKPRAMGIRAGKALNCMTVFMF